MVDGTEHGAGVVGLHKGAGTVVDGFTAEQHIVGIHDTVDKAQRLPTGNQRGLCRANVIEKLLIGIIGLGGSGIVPGNDIVE